MDVDALLAIRQFDGSDEVIPWIEHVLDVQAFMEWTDEKTLRAAKLRLIGDAYRWWEALPSTDKRGINAINVLEAAMLQRFPPADYITLWQEFTTLVCGPHEPISSYADRFRQLVDMLHIHDSASVVYQFLCGLPRSVQPHVVRSDPCSLHDAITTAICEERVLKYTAASQATSKYYAQPYRHYTRPVDAASNDAELRAQIGILHGQLQHPATQLAEGTALHCTTWPQPMDTTLDDEFYMHEDQGLDMDTLHDATFNNDVGKPLHDDKRSADSPWTPLPCALMEHSCTPDTHNCEGDNSCEATAGCGGGDMSASDAAFDPCPLSIRTARTPLNSYAMLQAGWDSVAAFTAHMEAPSHTMPSNNVEDEDPPADPFQELLVLWDAVETDAPPPSVNNNGSPPSTPDISFHAAHIKGNESVERCHHCELCCAAMRQQGHRANRDDIPAAGERRAPLVGVGADALHTSKRRRCWSGSDDGRAKKTRKIRTGEVLPFQHTKK